jgi:6,7-dimethyl-8-ribityllumazine synthase
MQDADKGQAAKLEGDGLVIGIVQARFNADLTAKLAEA